MVLMDAGFTWNGSRYMYEPETLRSPTTESPSVDDELNVVSTSSQGGSSAKKIQEGEGKS